jgi:acyl-CoA ligase (AMP-forming) (exosortase A-associated)
MQHAQPISLPQLLRNAAQQYPDAAVLAWRDQQLHAPQLQEQVMRWAGHMQASGIKPGDRVAIWLPKQFDMIIALFAASCVGAVFIPVNPGLKPAQLMYILADSGAALLISSRDRLRQIEANAAACLHWAIEDLGALPESRALCADPAVDALAAILYTSGSTGQPKGVMLSHANITLGAMSVARYLSLTAKDRVLCVLPLSFDYGLNQVMTALLTGAQAVLFEYLLPRDVLAAMARYCITGLAGVPALWSQLVTHEWPAASVQHLRYISNSGGRMPKAILDQLTDKTKACDIFLMYGLTEAFRSTYLDPALVAKHPESVGRAIPFAEVKIVRPDGSETAADEIGELVHMGPLVAQGYWQDAARTAERFRPAPACANQPGSSAVWSGDKARRDAAGLIYFVARDDEMIKSSGYRISPTEIEEILYGIPDIADAVVLGVADERIGAIIVAVVAPQPGKHLDAQMITVQCRQALPAYMVPTQIVQRPALPRNANGKLDRSAIAAAVRAGAWQ